MSSNGGLKIVLWTTIAAILGITESARAQSLTFPSQPGFGAPISGLTRADLTAFEEGKIEFATEEEVDEGLGPVFNGPSCGTCHTEGALGGAGSQTVTRFGRSFNGVFDPLAQYGGSLVQANGIGQLGACDYRGEVVPEGANVIAKRLTTPLFGLGLIDAVPATTLELIALTQPSSVRGRTNRVVDLATGQTVVGKFGWKAQVPTVFQFAGDAYLNEMGITSPMFPKENCPQGNCDLLACDPIPEFNGKVEDDGDGVIAFAKFMTFLAPPPVPPKTFASMTGGMMFNTLGCATCHTSSMMTGLSRTPALSLRVFYPYSDFLLHDMGNLGDGIGGQGRATTTEMRTAPLWGARVRTRFLHDGRAANVNDAILAHDGQGKAARDAYSKLSSLLKAQVIDFIESI